MGHAYRNEFELEPEQTNLKKQKDKKFTRDVYVPPTRDAGYNYFQYMVEAEYFFPALSILVGTLGLFGYLFYESLNAASHTSTAIVAFLFFLLPVLLGFATFFVSGVERANEVDCRENPSKRPGCAI